MVDVEKLKSKYNLSLNEYEAIYARVFELEKLEDFNGIIIGRCNGTLKSTKRWLKKHLSTKKEVDNCIHFFEDHGGFCNCEILYNVLPYVEKMVREVGINQEKIKELQSKID